MVVVMYTEFCVNKKEGEVDVLAYSHLQCMSDFAPIHYVIVISLNKCVCVLCVLVCDWCVYLLSVGMCACGVVCVFVCVWCVFVYTCVCVCVCVICIHAYV